MRRTPSSSLQLAADRVFCDIRNAGTYVAVRNGRSLSTSLRLTWTNPSGSVVTDVVSELRLVAFEWTNAIGEPIDPGKTVRRDSRPWGRLRLVKTAGIFAPMPTHLSLDGYQWSRRYRQPAVRLDVAPCQ